VKREKRLNRQRRRRRLRVRNAVKRNSTRPRLSVFRSHKHMCVQIIDDDSDERGSRTLVAVSTLDKDLRGQISYGGNCEAARLVGKTLAERALQAGRRRPRRRPRPGAQEARAGEARAEAGKEEKVEIQSEKVDGPMAEESTRGEVFDKVVKIRRCAAVVKGGRRFSFTALVVVGDGQGRVGWGYGKANEVPPAVEKAVKDGTGKMIEVQLDGTTIPHAIKGRYGAARVVLVPASPGTGVIAGAAVRAVCEACGIRDILTKSFGTTNPINLVKATIGALAELRSQGDVERLRGVSLS